MSEDEIDRLRRLISELVWEAVEKGVSLGTAVERERCRLIVFNKATEQATLTSWANHCTLMLLAVEKAIGEAN